MMGPFDDIMALAGLKQKMAGKEPPPPAEEPPPVEEAQS